MSEPRYLVRTPQGDMGPYTAEQIQAFVAQNQLPPDAHVIDTRVVTAAQIAGQAAPGQPPAPAPAPAAPPQSNQPHPAPAPSPQVPAQPPAPPQPNAMPEVALSPDLEAGFAAPGSGPAPAPMPAPIPGAGVQPVPAAPPPQQFGGNQVEIAPAPNLAPPPNAPVQPGTSGSGLRPAPGPGADAARRTGTRRHTNRQTGRTTRGGAGTDASARGSQRGGSRRARQTRSRSRNNDEMDDFEPMNDEQRNGGMAPGLIAAIIIGAIVLIGGGVVAALTLGGGDEQLQLSELEGEWHVDLAALETMPWYRKVGEFEKRDLVDRYTAETFAFPGGNTVVVYDGGEERWSATVKPRSVGSQRLRLQFTGETGAPYRSIDISRRGNDIVLDRAGRKTPLVRGAAEALQTARAAASPPPVTTPAEGEADPDADATANADPTEGEPTPPDDGAETAAADPEEGEPAADGPATADDAPPPDAAETDDDTTAPPRRGPKVSGSTATAEEAMAAIAGDWHADEEIFMANHYTRLLAEIRQRSEDPRAAPREAATLITKLFATLYRFSEGTYTESIGTTVTTKLTIEGASNRPDGNGWILYTEEDQPIEVIPTTQADSLILRFLPGAVHENGMDVPLAKGPPPEENVEAVSP